MMLNVNELTIKDIENYKAGRSGLKVLENGDAQFNESIVGYRVLEAPVTLTATYDYSTTPNPPTSADLSYNRSIPLPTELPTLVPIKDVLVTEGKIECILK